MTFVEPHRVHRRHALAATLAAVTALCLAAAAAEPAPATCPADTSPNAAGECAPGSGAAAFDSRAGEPATPRLSDNALSPDPITLSSDAPPLQLDGTGPTPADDPAPATADLSGPATPTPEPTTLAFLSAGSIVFLVSAARRRQRRRRSAAKPDELG